MKPKISILAVFFLVTFFFVGCNKNENWSKTPGEGVFIDLGQIPASLEASVEQAEFQSMIHNNGFLFVATSDGVWKCEISTKQWTQSGLDGKTISAIYKHPEVNNKFFAGVKSDNSPTQKTFYYSNDGGNSWTASISSPYDSLDNRFENVVCFAARKGNPDQVYAGLGGPSIAISTDGGINWVREDGVTGPQFGYQQNITFRGDDSNKLYIGSENPLDYAWVGFASISSSPTNLSNVTKVVSNEEYSNRRPTELLSFPYTGDALYVGQEGALSKISGSNNKLTFLFEKKTESGKYPYIYAIWVDPANTDHILFGGQGNGGQDMELYETYNEGKKVYRFTDKMGFLTPYIMDIISTNTHPAILIADRENNKVKVMLYESK